MARKRFISPEFFFHKKLWDAEQATGLPLRIAFTGLWTQADRRGIFQWDADRLGAQIVPFDRFVDFGAVLAALEEAGMIVAFAPSDELFGYIPSFKKWQSFHPNERASSHPDFDVRYTKPSKGWLKPSNGVYTGNCLVAIPTPTLPYLTSTLPHNGGGGLQSPPSPPEATDTEACAADSGEADAPTTDPRLLVGALAAALDARSRLGSSTDQKRYSRGAA